MYREPLCFRRDAFPYVPETLPALTPSGVVCHPGNCAPRQARAGPGASTLTLSPLLQALSVGIFPYVLKLLQSSARELRPLLVFIWAKILAVDSVSNRESWV